MAALTVVVTAVAWILVRDRPRDGAGARPAAIRPSL
jgi:hypothetical protein